MCSGGLASRTAVSAPRVSGLSTSHASGATVTPVTPHGSAEGRLSDIDPWGRFQIAGTGRPPF